MKQASRVLTILLLLLCVGTAWGHGCYTFKNLNIVATCDKGTVYVKGDVFEFQDSLVIIGIQMNERTPCNIKIDNRYNKPIIVKWKRILASNNDRDFYSRPNTYFIDADKNTDEDKLYKGESRSYILSNWTDEMFSKKKKGQKGKVSVSIVVNDELVQYIFTLEANPIEK